MIKATYGARKQGVSLVLLGHLWGDFSAMISCLLFSPGRYEGRKRDPLFLRPGDCYLDCLQNFTAGNQVKLIKCVS